MSQLPSEESQSPVPDSATTDSGPTTKVSLAGLCTITSQSLPSNSTWLQLEERYGAFASCQKAFARLERKRPCNTFSTKLMLPVQRLRHGDCTSDEETSDCWAQSLSSGLGLLSNWTQHLPSIEDHQITPKEIMIWDSFDVMFLCTKCAITSIAPFVPSLGAPPRHQWHAAAWSNDDAEDIILASQILGLQLKEQINPRANTGDLEDWWILYILYIVDTIITI